MSLSGMVEIPRPFDTAQGMLQGEMKIRHAGAIVTPVKTEVHPHR